MSLQPESFPLSRKQKNSLIAGAVLVFLIPLILSRVLLLLHLSDLNLLIASRFIYWSAAGLLWLYAVKVERQPFVLWNQNYPIDFYIRWAVKLYLLAIAASMVSAIPNWLGWHDDTVIMRKWMNIMVTHYWLLLFCAITAGITEELICRVYLVPRLALLFKNSYMPVIVSAAIFSALHYRYFSLRETIFTFLIGVIFAAHYQKYRNIHVLILVHFMIDFFSFLVARYALEHHLKTFGMLLF